MRLCFAEDAAAVDLEPLTLTRPTFELLLGSGTIGAKIARAFAPVTVGARAGAVVRPHLAATVEATGRYAAVNNRDWLARGPVLVVNGRWVPPADFVAPRVEKPTLGLCEGRPACAWVGPGQAIGLELHTAGAWFDELTADLECFDIGGEWIDRPWDLVARNAGRIAADFEAAGLASLSERHRATAQVVGPLDRLFVHETARVDPYTVFDTTNGPITVQAGAFVQPFTRIEGPCHVGRDTQLFRASVRGGVTLGPNCRIGGEVEASIVHGHSNKYHEGFLGHAYVGEWVNLGAITSNSDLRNDYGEVRVPVGGEPVATGMTKVGCFIGDHSRTGMGCMLNTGTSIGVMCNVLPAGFLLPKHVPSFSSVQFGRVSPGLALEKVFETARVVLGRRGREFTAADEHLYRSLFDKTRMERERAVHKTKERTGDHWPLLAASAAR